jgi:hypothetical protein
MTEQTPIPRCGDTVFHIPTGEEWLVAWAEGNELSWCGWPPGIAKLSDCIIRKRCTDEEHRKTVHAVSKVSDFRGARVKRLYAAALDPEPASPLTATAAAPEAPRFPDHVHEGAIEAGLFRLNFVAQKHVRVHYDAALAEIVTPLHAEIEALKADLAQHFSAAAKRPGEDMTAWLIEAPGLKYLATRFLGKYEFHWTADRNAALKFYTEQQADMTMMAVRESEPHLFAFAALLGDAKPVAEWLDGRGRPHPTPPEPAPIHSDDIAVDEFAAAMKGKLAIARLKGRAGWQNCDLKYLWTQLTDHFVKGDARDIANYCMMIWHVDTKHTWQTFNDLRCCAYCGISWKSEVADSNCSMKCTTR